MKKIDPLKRFGQNYLIDKNIIRKLVDELNPIPGDNLVEIGPGRGSITKELFTRVDNLTAVEIDKRINEELSEKFPNLKLINKDFLKISLEEHKQSNEKPMRFVGNIPFNITSPIIFKLINGMNMVQDAVFIVQHEVAKRMTAPFGSKDYGILSVVLNSCADVKLCFKISPQVFRPIPKVWAAVVHIKFKDEVDDSIQDLFNSVVKASFGNRRKTLKNSLSNSIFSNCNLENSNIDISKRAEELTIDDFFHLTKFISAGNYEK